MFVTGNRQRCMGRKPQASHLFSPMASRNSKFAVMAHDSDRVVYFETADRAPQLIAAGVLSVDHEARALRIVPGNHAITVQPGSFGIRREHKPVGRDYGLAGGVVFSHQERLYEGLAA